MSVAREEEEMNSSLSVVSNEAEVGRPDHSPRRNSCRSSGHSHERFFGVEVEKVSPKAQVVLASTVLAPVLLSGIFLVVFVPQLWWIFTTYGWISFPAFGLLVRGMVDISTAPSGRGEALSSAASKEQELLAALSKHGELTSTRAAIETSLSVAEADRMLGGLAESGHLEVRVRGGGLFYSLWGNDEWKEELS